jgi:hypothetical protein
MSEAENHICRALREGKIRFQRAFEAVTFRGYPVHPEVFRRMIFEDRNRFRLRVPPDLASEDLDWENSRPRRPWPLGEGYFAHIARLELSRRDLEKVFSPVEAKASNEARGEASQVEAERRRAEAETKRRLAEARRKRKRAEERGARKALEGVKQADAERKRAEARRKRKRAEGKRKRAKERAAREALEEASHANDTGRARPRRYWAHKAIDGAYPKGPPSKEEVPNKTFVAEVAKFGKDKGWKVGGPDTILREAGRRK